MWGLILDGVVAALLLLTIATALLLNRRLGALNRERATLQALVNDLATMSSRAEAAVSNLRMTAEQSGRNLLQSVERAEKLSTDLHFVIDRGNSVANRLDETVRSARAEVKTEPAAERQPEKAVRPERPAGEGRTASPAADKPARPRRTGANRSATILGQLYGEGAMDEAESAPDAPSRAERDLLRALTGAAAEGTLR